MRIKPYGDTSGDGAMQLSFTLPVAAGPAVAAHVDACPRCATCRLRALCRPLPLPCANRTIPSASGGIPKSPRSVTPSSGIFTSISFRGVSKVFMVSLQAPHL